ncbi:FliI/YscN family ATPase [Ideonella sp. YS5]|uniref:FliI/YscN family ATPase n=1 Tax=Ideonella sp. YS5 TaxID=3453714 RepID=UPI003EE8D87D
MLQSLRQATATAELVRRVGVVRQVTGLSIEAEGPDVTLGELCRILPRQAGAPVLAEVVSLRRGLVTLMPFRAAQGLAAGCRVEALGQGAQVPVGPALLGRVIDGFGHALDGLPDPARQPSRPVKAAPINPLHRPRVSQVLETGVRAIDSMLTLGLGQRVGIFAGSGVGKSTLLGMIARHVKADVNVIALIGERGREVKEFIDKHLGPEGLRRSVVVVAASDQPALARLHAAYAAIAIAEAFRDQGQQVVLTMDSITRFAMARREIGLSAGEPPTARGYTPSVFAELPELCERCGTAPSGGSITALLTVLVEGDDHNEPIADNLRAILDGHIVLSRQLAQQAHFPAIDVLQSASRVMSDLAGTDELKLARQTMATLDLLERNRQLVDIGAYVAGSNAELDGALRLKPGLQDFLRQSEGGASRPAALQALHHLMSSSKAGPA